MSAARPTRDQLIASAARQRAELAGAMAELAGPLRIVDVGLAGIRLMRRHPVWTAVGLFALKRLWPASPEKTKPLSGLRRVLRVGSVAARAFPHFW